MSDDCKDVLLAKNFGNFSYRHYSSLFLLQLIEKSNYDSAKTKIGAAIPDMFSGDYDNFETSRANEFSRLNLNISDDEALSALHVTGYAGATSAWQQCMSKNRKELFTVVVGNISDLIFDVQIYWEPPTGNTGSPLKNVQIWLSGEGGVVTIENADRLPRELKPGKDVIQVRRSSNKTIVRGYVKGDLGTSVCSSIIYVPKFVADPQFAPVYLAKRPYLIVPGSVKNVQGEPKNRFGMRVDDCLVWVEDFWKFDMPSGQLVQTSLEEREGYVTICEVFALMRFIVSPELLSTELDGTTKKSWDKSCPDGIVILLFAMSVSL